MLFPGIALNFGSARSKIRVKIGQVEVTAVAATEINSRDVTVAYSGNSNTYLVWGNSAPKRTGLERNFIKRQGSRLVKKEKQYYPFKILLYFYSANSDLEYYLKGGDKTLMPLTPILEALGVDITPSGIIGFVNVGKKKTDWVLFYKDEINNSIITYDNRTKESTILSVDPNIINNSKYIGDGVLQSYGINNLDFSYSNSSVISDSVNEYSNNKIQYYQLHHTLHSEELIDGEDVTFNRSLSHVDTGNNEFLPTRTFNYQETSTSNRNLNIIVLDSIDTQSNSITINNRLISEEFTDALSFASSFTITTNEKSTFYFYDQLIEGTRIKVRTLTENGDFNSSWKEVARERKEENEQEWTLVDGVFLPSQTYELGGSASIGSGTEVYNDSLVINYSFRDIDFIYSEIYTENNIYNNNVSTNVSNQQQPVLIGELQPSGNSFTVVVFDSNTIDNNIKASFTTSRNKVFTRNGTVDIAKDNILLVTSEYVFWEHEEQSIDYTDRWEVDQSTNYVKEVASESSLSRRRPDSVNFALEIYNGEFDFIGLRIYDINNHESTQNINSFPLSQSFFTGNLFTYTSFERFVDLSGYNFKGFTRTINNSSFKGVAYNLNNLSNREKACRFDYFQFNDLNTQKTIYYKHNGEEDKVKLNFNDAFLCNIRDVFINEPGDYELSVWDFYAGLDSDLTYFDWANSSSRTRDETSTDVLFTTSDYENIARWTDPSFTNFWNSIISRTDITIISYDQNDRESINVCTGRINNVTYSDIDYNTRFKRDVNTINITVESISKEYIFTYRNQVWDNDTMTHIFSRNCNILVYEVLRESSLKRWFNMVGNEIYLTRHIYDRDNIDRFSKSTKKNFADVYELNNGVFTRRPNLNSNTNKKQNISQTVKGGYLANPYISYYPPK